MLVVYKRVALKYRLRIIFHKLQNIQLGITATAIPVRPTSQTTGKVHSPEFEDLSHSDV
jgi:hypothetical protein